MFRGPGRWLLVALALAVMAGVASALDRASQAGSPIAMAEGIRDEMREIRTQLAACQTTQDQIELRFQTLTRRTQELREEVDVLEGLDPRGVPADRYEHYLALVEEYNTLVDQWEGQGEDLRAHSARCRNLIEAHNQRADSLQRFLVDHGIWEASWIESADESADESDPAGDGNPAGGSGDADPDDGQVP